MLAIVVVLVAIGPLVLTGYTISQQSPGVEGGGGTSPSDQDLLRRDCVYTFSVIGSGYLAVKGDGGGKKISGTDFSTVFSNAVADAGAGRYCLSSGTFTIPPTSTGYTSRANCGIQITSNMWISGEGPSTILKSSSMPNQVICNKQFATDGSAQESNMTITDISIKGFAPTGGTFTAGDAGIIIYNFRNVFVRNVFVSGFNGNAM